MYETVLPQIRIWKTKYTIVNVKKWEYLREQKQNVKGRLSWVLYFVYLEREDIKNDKRKVVCVRVCVHEEKKVYSNK